MTFAAIYDLYQKKVIRKGQSLADLDTVICWLTGFSEAELAQTITDKLTFTDFFERARLHPNASLITGMICGVRIEEIEDPLMQKIRYLDKVVDEVANGRKLEKIMRQVQNS
jgi:hypothetical protein